jgi:GT2 family glycosyltransferase
MINNSIAHFHHICIIIPTFNRKIYLRTILNQLYNQKLTTAKLTVIVIVDGSLDGTIDMIQNEFSSVIIIYGDGTWWYTKSMNEGFKYASKLNPDFVLTLNDDVELSKDYIENILNAYFNVEGGSIIGSLCISKDLPHRIMNSGNVLKNKLFLIYKNYLPFLSTQDDSELTGIKPTSILPGRGILIPFNTLLSLNFFDNRFIQYHSDGDFCLRASKKGFNIYISWDALIYGHLDLTSSDSSFRKQKFSNFIKSFFNKYSRNYLPAKALLIWRHHTKILLPVVLLSDILLSIKNYIIKK